MKNSQFSTLLKSFMEEHGISQKWLAEASNTTEATISRYINGIHQPNISLVMSIAKALNVSVDYLLGNTAIPSINSDKTPELKLLIRCYNKASDRDKKLLWSILEDYMTEDEKDAILHSPSKESITG